METQLIIDNKPQSAADGSTFDRVHPLSGDVVTRGAAANVDDALAAVESAAEAFKTWSQTGPSERRAVMLKAADIMDRRTPELIEAMGQEVGAAPLWAGFNGFLTSNLLREAAGLATQIQGETIPTDKPGTLSMTVRVPAGVVLSMAPWNGAGVLAARAIAYPIVCGNTVVFRGSELSPRSHQLIAEVFHEAGLPAGVLNFITTAPEASDERWWTRSSPTRPSVGSTSQARPVSAGSSRRRPPATSRPVCSSWGARHLWSSWTTRTSTAP